MKRWMIVMMLVMAGCQVEEALDDAPVDHTEAAVEGEDENLSLAEVQAGLEEDDLHNDNCIFNCGQGYLDAIVACPRRLDSGSTCDGLGGSACCANAREDRDECEDWCKTVCPRVFHCWPLQGRDHL
jgi:hypothetical protein